MPLTQTAIITDTTDLLTAGHLPQYADTIAGTQRALVEVSSASDIFGGASRLAEQVFAGAPRFEWVVTGGVFYSLAVAACFAGFCLLLYYFMPHAVTVLNMFRGTLYVEKLLDEHNYIFEIFRRLIIVTGIMMTGLLIVRYADASWGETAGRILPPWAVPLPVVAVWAALAAVWFFQNLVIRLVGWLTYGGRFTRDLISLRNLGYGLLFLLSVPLMLVVALSPPRPLLPLSVILFTLLAGLFIFLLFRTYLLFISQKISILYWILYLCAVEILPISFLVILTIRNIQ